MAEEAHSKGEAHLVFLDRLLLEEVSAKEERRLRTSLKIVGLPFAKTIEGYDFDFHESLDKRTVMSLFDLDFVGKKENVIFLGPPGVGKTHLATALEIKACYSGISIYFTIMAHLIGNRDGLQIRIGSFFPIFHINYPKKRFIALSGFPAMDVVQPVTSICNL